MGSSRITSSHLCTPSGSFSSKVSMQGQSHTLSIPHLTHCTHLPPGMHLLIHSSITHSLILHFMESPWSPHLPKSLPQILDSTSNELLNTPPWTCQNAAKRPDHTHFSSRALPAAGATAHWVPKTETQELPLTLPARHPGLTIYFPNISYTSCTLAFSSFEILMVSFLFLGFCLLTRLSPLPCSLSSSPASCLLPQRLHLLPSPPSCSPVLQGSQDLGSVSPTQPHSPPSCSPVLQGSRDLGSLSPSQPHSPPSCSPVLQGSHDLGSLPPTQPHSPPSCSPVQGSHDLGSLPPTQPHLAPSLSPIS